jgi:2-dehydropantoate 2-reductase
MRTIVVGSGGIGGTVAAVLSDAGWEVSLLTRNPKTAASIRARGLRARLQNGTQLLAHPRAVSDVEQLDGRFDLALLCTQAADVADAARVVAERLEPNALMLCLQNGLCELHVAEVLDELALRDRVRLGGAIVTFAASRINARDVTQTATGGVTIGLLASRSLTRKASQLKAGQARGSMSGAPELGALGKALAPAGPYRLTDNLLGARWTKLAISCAVTPISVLSGGPLGRCIGHRAVRELALALISEALQVAASEGVVLAPVAKTVDLRWLDPGRLLPAEAAARSKLAWARRQSGLAMRHALVYALGYRFRRLRSSMLAAIERGQPPSIDYLNGEIVRRGDARGFSMPANRAVVDAVWQIAKRKLQPSVTLLLEIAKGAEFVR